VVRVREAFNPITKSFEPETLPYDAKPLFARRQTAPSSGDFTLGTFSVPSGKYAIITAIKYMSDSPDTWFSFGGDIVDFGYLPGAGVDVIEGSPDDPIATLDEGEQITSVVLSASSGSTYAVVIYGILRDKAPVY